MYQVKLSFRGFGIWFYPRFWTSDSLFGTSRPLNFIVYQTTSIKVKIDSRTTYVVTFRGGNNNMYDGKVFEGSVEIDRFFAPPVKIHWRSSNDGKVGTSSPPCSIRRAIWGLF